MSFSIPNTKVIVATCNLNQWAMDFDQNLERIIQSVIIAKEKGAKFRLGPELEICGYSCEDHFFEVDTFLHSEQSLATLLSSDLTDNILCEFGAPMIHNNVRYNCRIFCLNRKILLIRPKMFLADDGNYRERRFFTSWKQQSNSLEDFVLSDILKSVTGQTIVPIGNGVLATKETKLAAEVCEELWTPNSPHIALFLSGVEIITNASGSHHQLRKLNSRLSLIQNATKTCGGAYLYANHRGCDGQRLYFDGSALISLNGDILQQASQFSLTDVEVITAVIDLNDIRSYRHATNSLQEQASQTLPFPIIDIRYFSLTSESDDGLFTPVSPAIPVRYHTPEEECALGPACWLWDYLRRSGSSGFLLPLSGGSDSSSVAAIVLTMCHLAVTAAAQQGNKEVMKEINRLMQREENTNNNSSSSSSSLSNISALTTDAVSTNLGNNQQQQQLQPIFSNIPTPTELCGSVLNTLYMATQNSSLATRNRAFNLAQSIGAYHTALQFDSIIEALLTVFSTTMGGKIPRYESQGGTAVEDIALQNIQARLRMIVGYLCAQLFPWVRGRKGFLLVLGSANVDESLRGYMTKYDCSSADVNPIGGICKGDLKRMMSWAAKTYNITVLEEIVKATPTAELRPIAEGELNDYTQTDEEDMGMTYAELGVFGVLRKMHRCGPVSMFLKLLDMWSIPLSLSPSEIAAKVKRFFYYYSLNRHKMTTLTPSYHAENYGTDDNRFDLRQFLYNIKWPRQFACIDDLVTRIMNNKKKTITTNNMSDTNRD